MQVFYLHPVSILTISLIVNEYSKFNKLCKSVVSNLKANCFAAIGYVQSVKITLVQCNSFFILSQFSVSEIQNDINSVKYFFVN